MKERALRIAHLTTVDSSLAILLRTELIADVEAGFEVIGLSAPGPFVPEVESFGVTHHEVPDLTRTWDPARDLRAARQLWRLLDDLELDVLHTHTPKAGVMGRLIGRLAGVPVVVNTCHGLWAQRSDPRFRRLAVLLAEALAARFSDAELYQNDEDRRALRWAVPSQRATTVGNGVDLTVFRPDARGAVSVRAELGVPPDGLLVGGVGRRVAEKGIAEFAGMARTLRRRARFVWIGPEDPDKPGWDGDDDGTVEFLGMRRDMPAVYSALDLFVLPSYREGFSRSAMEAAACGTAMVLSDIRGCREIGQHEREVVLVPPGDVERLTVAVGDLLDDAVLRNGLGNAVRERARQSFDQRQVAGASIATYRRVLERKRIRPLPSDRRSRPRTSAPL